MALGRAARSGRPGAGRPGKRAGASWPGAPFARRPVQQHERREQRPDGPSNALGGAFDGQGSAAGEPRQARQADPGKRGRRTGQARQANRAGAASGPGRHGRAPPFARRPDQQHERRKQRPDGPSNALGSAFDGQGSAAGEPGQARQADPGKRGGRTGQARQAAGVGRPAARAAVSSGRSGAAGGRAARFRAGVAWRGAFGVVCAGEGGTVRWLPCPG
ncbi:hypothetical protein GCM10010254_46470 [Streptomyces chromofuscus]|nr:hypothetical protein GCM10010254_46470 [Streptomyces chromofuscus]